MCLYHYYDSTIGPFKSLTAISPDEATDVVATLHMFILSQRRVGNFASQKRTNQSSA